MNPTLITFTRSFYRIITAIFLGVLLTNARPAASQVAVDLSGFDGAPGETIEVGVELAGIESSIGFSSFSFTVVLNTPGVVFLGHDVAASLSSTTGWSVNSSTTTNRVGGFSSSSNLIGSSGTLILLRFRLDSVSNGATLRLEDFALALGGIFLVHNPAVPTASLAGQNGPPTANSTFAQTNEEEAVNIFLTGADPENDPISFAISQMPDHGALLLNGATASYSPEPDFFGSDSFTFFTSDALSDSAPALVTITVHNVNDPPTEPILLTPGQGASVLVAGDPAGAIDISWAASSDVDGDDLVYEWQLSKTNSFLELLLDVAAGFSTSAQLSVDQLASLLSAEGITVGGILDVFQRVIVSDGTVSVTGPAQSLSLERGIVTATENAETIPTSLELETPYPSPASSSVTLRYRSPSPGVISMRVYDLLGRVALTLHLARTGPGTQVVDLDVTPLISGIYFLTLSQGTQTVQRELIINR